MAYKEFKGIGPLRYGSAFKQTEYIKTGDGKRIYPQITSKDSTNIKNAFRYLSQPDIGKSTEVGFKKKIDYDKVTSDDVKSYDKDVLKELNTLANTYSLDAVKGVRDHYGYGPKNK